MSFVDEISSYRFISWPCPTSKTLSIHHINHLHTAYISKIIIPIVISWNVLVCKNDAKPKGSYVFAKKSKQFVMRKQHQKIIPDIRPTSKIKDLVILFQMMHHSLSCHDYSNCQCDVNVDLRWMVILGLKPLTTILSTILDNTLLIGHESVIG